MFGKRFFVLAPSYQGATLLAKLINAHPEVTSLGDTYPSNAFDQICGCGERVSQCRFWQAVRVDTDAQRYAKRTRSMLPTYPSERGGLPGRIAYSDFLCFYATPPMLRLRHGAAALATFREDYEAFAAAVHRDTLRPGHVFVDGVKSISRFETLLAAGTGIDGVIHMRRDPVDCVASSIRNTGRGGWVGTGEHALRHRLYHAHARQAARHARAAINVSYEALADDTDAELARIFRFLGVAEMTVAELHRYFFGAEWHFMGNASLVDFDGTIRRSRHTVSPTRRRVIRAIAGA